MKVFDQHWFIKHQKLLVWLARSPLGSLVFRYRKMGHCVDRKLLVKITPNSVAEFLGYKDGQIELREHFFTRNEYARKLYFALLPMWWAMHAWDWIVADQLAPQLSFGFSTLTQNPGTIGAGNPTDGKVLRTTNYPNGETFANLLAGTGTGVYQGKDETDDLGIFIGCGKYTTNWWGECDKTIVCFDTSSLTSGATITVVVASLREPNSGNTQMALGNENIVCVGATPASTTVLATGDYLQFGAVEWGHITTPVTKNAYNDATFNASGIAGISKTGITKLGFLFNSVFTGTPLTWQSGQAFNGMQVVLSGSSSNKPKLVVTYSVIVTSGNMFLVLD